MNKKLKIHIKSLRLKNINEFYKIIKLRDLRKVINEEEYLVLL
jgi:hypothetical protein